MLRRSRLNEFPLLGCNLLGSPVSSIVVKAWLLPCACWIVVLEGSSGTWGRASSSPFIRVTVGYYISINILLLRVIPVIRREVGILSHLTSRAVVSLVCIIVLHYFRSNVSFCVFGSYRSLLLLRSWPSPRTLFWLSPLYIGPSVDQRIDRAWGWHINASCYLRNILRGTGLNPFPLLWSLSMNNGLLENWWGRSFFSFTSLLGRRLPTSGMSLHLHQCWSSFSIKKLVSLRDVNSLQLDLMLWFAEKTHNLSDIRNLREPL